MLLTCCFRKIYSLIRAVSGSVRVIWGWGSARCRPVLILACEAILLSRELKRFHPGDKSSLLFREQRIARVVVC